MTPNCSNGWVNLRQTKQRPGQTLAFRHRLMQPALLLIPCRKQVRALRPSCQLICPGELTAFDCANENGVRDIVSMRINHGVAEGDAQRYVCVVWRGGNDINLRNGTAGFFNAYGQGVLSRAAV